MTIEELVERYIETARQVFQQIEEEKDSRDARAARTLNYAKRYFDDAVYYRDQKRFETALASVAYCEGLLDALSLLGIVKFEWPTTRKQGTSAS
jgi:FAD synthetase